MASLVCGAAIIVLKLSDGATQADGALRTIDPVGTPASSQDEGAPLTHAVNGRREAVQDNPSIKLESEPVPGMAGTPEVRARAFLPRLYSDNGAMLNHIWGAEWDLVRAEIEAKDPKMRIDLNARPEIVEFGNLRAEFLKALENELIRSHSDYASASLSPWSPIDLDDEYFANILNGRRIEKEELSQLEKLIQPEIGQLTVLLDTRFSALREEVLSAFDQGRNCSAYPLYHPKVRRSTVAPSDLFFARIATHGWVIEVHIATSGRPEFASWATEIVQLRDQVDSKVQNFLRG